MEGKTQLEIATELKMSDRQVRRDLDRLRERLREIFDMGAPSNNQ